MIACVGCMVNTAIRDALPCWRTLPSSAGRSAAPGDACRGGVARPSDQARSGTIFDAASPVTIAGKPSRPGGECYATRCARRASLDASATSRARTREDPWRTRAFSLPVMLDGEVRKRPFPAPSGRERCTEGAQLIGRVQHRDLESRDAPRPAIAYLADAPTHRSSPPANAVQPFASPPRSRWLRLGVLGGRRPCSILFPT